MNRLKRVLQVLSVGFCTLMLHAMACSGQSQVVQIEEETCALGASAGVRVEQTLDDLMAVPDKFNTGCTGALVQVELDTSVEGVQFVATSNNTRRVLDFAYHNKNVAGTVTFENYDFSNYPLYSYNENMVKRTIKVVFKNCKFSTVSVGKEKGNLSFEFDNCTLESYNGSNVVFNHCQFGRSYTDGLVPFQNVEVNNCFFLDMASEACGNAIHTDGTQIYGKDGVDVQNVNYNNCRFELPAFDVAGSKAYVNACIMLQLEYSNAKNVSFNNCIVNGGGYSIYARDVGKGYTFDNVKFEGIRSGCVKKYGTIYSQINPSIEFKDITETNALYIASVWKEGGNTHFSVTNDTNAERKLLIYTNRDSYEFAIPACPKGEELTSNLTYEDMPFDLEIVIPENCEYAICYDNTLDGYAEQIRFVNWSGKEVYLEKKTAEALTANGNDVLCSGSCGASVEFTLTKSGVLYLKGEGNMSNYSSNRVSPWWEYNNFIKTIVVEDGIERIGSQSFRRCVSVQNVVLPDGLKVIGNRAFAGCTGLTTISVPASVEKIEASAFSGNILQEIQYRGADWSKIELESGNEDLTKKVVCVTADSTEEVSKIVMQGECGRQADYLLTDDGVLKITGTGATYNYNSNKVAPWFENRELIKVVVIDEGIDKVGQQLFRSCKNLRRVELPQGLNVIGTNAFIFCSDLCEITIPQSLDEIQQRAFYGVKKINVQYGGCEKEWQQIAVDAYNDVILKNVSYN